MSRTRSPTPPPASALGDVVVNNTFGTVGELGIRGAVAGVKAGRRAVGSFLERATGIGEEVAAGIREATAAADFGAPMPTAARARETPRPLATETDPLSQEAVAVRRADALRAEEARAAREAEVQADAEMRARLDALQTQEPRPAGLLDTHPGADPRILQVLRVEEPEPLIAPPGGIYGRPVFDETERAVREVMGPAPIPEGVQLPTFRDVAARVPGEAPPTTAGTAVVPFRERTPRRLDWTDEVPQDAGAVWRQASERARDMTDEELRAAYRQTLRAGFSAEARHAPYLGRGGRIYEGSHGKGMVGTGAGAYQRGAVTQADHRLAAYENELQARRLDVPHPDEAFADVRADGLLYGVAEDLPLYRALDEVQLRDELVDMEARLTRNPGDVEAAQRRGILAALAHAKGAGLDVPDYALAGYATADLVHGLARTGTGAAAGAAIDAQDGDDPLWDGAALGAAAGLGAPAVVRGARALDEVGAVGPREPGQIPSRLDAAMQRAEARAGTQAAPAAEATAGAPTGSGTAGGAAPSLNLRRLQLDPDGEELVREKLADLAARGAIDQRIQTHDAVRAAADRLKLRPDLLAAPKGGKVTGPEMVALSDGINDTARELERIEAALNSGTLSVEETALRQAEYEAHSVRLENMTGKLFRGGREAGQTLNTMRILARRSRDPSLWLVRATKAKGGALTDAEATAVRKALNDADPDAVARVVAGFREAGWGEKAATLWKTGLLSGPGTWAVNIGGNVTWAMMEQASRPVAFMLDRLAGVVTGAQTVANPFRAERAVALRTGADRGVRRAARALGITQAADAVREGRGVRGAVEDWTKEIRGPDLSRSKFVDNRSVNFKTPLLDVATKLVFRGLSAQDAFFREIAIADALESGAQVMARAEGLKGKALKARVREIVVAPSDELTIEAIDAGSRAVFEMPTTLGSALGRAKQDAYRKSQGFGLAVDVVAPFVGVPSAILTGVADYTPVALIRSTRDALDLLQKAVAAPDVAKTQRRMVDTAARATTGAALFMAGLGTWQAGRLTGGRPQDENEAAAWEADGRQPYSVLIGGQWRRYDRLAPGGTLLALAADFAEAFERPGVTMAGRVGDLARVPAGVVAEMPVLEGPGGLYKALSDRSGREGERYVRQLAGSVVPAAVRTVARAADPYVPEQRELLDGVRASVPGLTQTLPVQRDVFGEPIRRAGGPLTVAVDPTRPTDDRRDDPVRAEVGRLGYAPGGLTRGKEESAEEFDERQDRAGAALYEALADLIGSEEYQQEPEALAREMGAEDEAATADAIRREMVRQVAREVRAAVNREFRARLAAPATR